MNEDDLSLSQRLNLETARIRWHELQGHFAAGSVIAIAAHLDLITVAEQLAADNAAQVKAWMDAGDVAPVSDAQAQDWYDNDAECWALVIKPWVLVQGITAES